ncbi:MAG: antibiotic biosynthesis monooxygenase [Phaeodactylibacter sp.]|nr:antibiotic biosynthesis monooxygenase [Phaeodactylibacter sp.]
MIKRIVKLTFQPEKVDDFLAIFRDSGGLIRAFPCCHHVELLRCTEPDNVFFTYSFWEDGTALERYRRSALFRSTWKRTRQLFAGEPEAWSTVEWGG